MNDPKIQYLVERLTCFEDPDFKFDPKLHRYTYHGEVFQSVTTLVGTFHKPFDTEGKSKKVAEDTGFDQDWIKAQWAETNRYANEIGTATHEWIEDYFNGIWRHLPTNPDIIHRINKFNGIYCERLHKLDPVKFELRIFSKKWKKAGTIDSIFLKDGKNFILDWKTNKKFTHDDHPDGRYQRLLWPFENFYKNHLNEYSIQLSMYAAILEEWGFEVGGAYLVHIGPDDGPAKIHRCRDMRPQLETYFANS